MCRNRTTYCGIAMMLALAAGVVPAGGQEVAPRSAARTLSGFDPAQRPEAVDPPVPSFVESLSKNSSTIEVKLGQGRILALKRRLTAPGQNAPFLAVGDPNVLDFFVVGPQQVRLIGKKLGMTDLSITIGAGAQSETLDFEVQVVADLDVLRGELRQMFPDASLKLG